MICKYLKLLILLMTSFFNLPQIFHFHAVYVEKTETFLHSDPVL